MRQEQWELFKTVAKGGKAARPPVALIIDSPWLPPYMGVKHLDYYFDRDTWFATNRKMMEEFPEMIVFPSWWMEYGMAIEPSALGSKIRFYVDQTPNEVPTLLRLEDVESFPPVNPSTDGLMPVALHNLCLQKTRIRAAGYDVRVATARGPLCIAGFLRGITELMMDIVDNPPGVHKLLAYVTDAIVKWLQAQAEAADGSIEGVFILDDVIGMLSRAHYQEFAHPYLKRIFTAFPENWVKVYHNDANTQPFAEDLPDAGMDVLNWTYRFDLAEARRRTGGKITLMGNVAPLELGVRGTPQQVKEAGLALLRQAGDSRFILSLGGGVSPGTPKANIMALLEAAREFSGA